MSTAATPLDFEQLPFYKKRSFLRVKVDFMDPEEVKGFYEVLLKRPIQSSQDLEQWIFDRSELEAALDQAGAVLYIKMTSQTDDAKISSAYKEFVEKIIPVIKPLEHQLNQKHLAERVRFHLDKARYHVYDRMINVDVEVFQEKNIPLQTQVQLLSQEYQTVCGAMTVEFQGKEMTLQQMRKFLFESDRNLRESAWQTMAQRRLQDKKALDDIFDKMMALRSKIAAQSGYANFCEYQFRAYHRFDYTPQDCRKYHEIIQKVMVPLWKDILDKRRKDLNLDELRPWDLDVDPHNQPVLKPFDNVESLIKGVRAIFERMDGELGEQFAQMAEGGFLDLESRKGKAPGGYQCTLAETRKPFIFMNAVGIDEDVRTLLHESGHAFHALSCAEDPLFAYRHAPMEFCEVASMSMELLAGDYLTEFYNPADAKRSNHIHLEDIVRTLIWVAVVDAFQHWIYENPQHTAFQRHKAWAKVYDQFGGNLLNWKGLEHIYESLWHRQLHIFECPFYYIEYGIALLGALQVWQHSKNDFNNALQNYRAALSLGGSKPLPELFKSAGMEFDFSQKVIEPIAAMLRKELKI